MGFKRKNDMYKSEEYDGQWLTRNETIRQIVESSIHRFKMDVINRYYSFPFGVVDNDAKERLPVIMLNDEGVEAHGVWLKSVGYGQKTKEVDEKFNEVMKALGLSEDSPFSNEEN
jgi:hypothetical protein